MLHAKEKLKDQNLSKLNNHQKGMSFTEEIFIEVYLLKFRLSNSAKKCTHYGLFCAK